MVSASEGPDVSHCVALTPMAQDGGSPRGASHAADHPVASMSYQLKQLVKLQTPKKKKSKRALSLPHDSSHPLTILILRVTQAPLPPKRTGGGCRPSRGSTSMGHLLLESAWMSNLPPAPLSCQVGGYRVGGPHLYPSRHCSPSLPAPAAPAIQTEQMAPSTLTASLSSRHRRAASRQGGGGGETACVFLNFSWEF